MAEIDVRPTWVIPGSRMKAGREHRVAVGEGPRHPVGVAPRRRARVLAGVGADQLLEPYPGHGPRRDRPWLQGAFADWPAESDVYPRELGEIALAHTVGMKRSRLSPRRHDGTRAAVDADGRAHCERPPTTGEKVVAIREMAQ